jgi:hypothetical protein
MQHNNSPVPSRRKNKILLVRKTFLAFADTLAGSGGAAGLRNQLFRQTAADKLSYPLQLSSTRCSSVELFSSSGPVPARKRVFQSAPVSSWISLIGWLSKVPLTSVGLIISSYANFKAIFRQHKKSFLRLPPAFKMGYFSPIQSTISSTFTEGTGVAVNQLPSLADHISFIVFNYDRCLEQFLFRGLKQLYDLSDDNAAAIVRRFKIIHPYGTVGELKMLLEQPKPAIPFGGYAEDNYVKLAWNIKTYTEQVAGGKLERDIQIEMKRAECVVFLGFGFHETNIALLNPDDMPPRIPIFATGTGLSPSNVETISWRLRNQYNEFGVLEMEPSIRIERHLNCRALLEEFEKRLLGG